MCAAQVTWEQTRGFRLARMHLASPLGPRSLRRVARDLGGIHAQVASAAELQCAVRTRGLARGTIERALTEERSLVKTWAMRGTLHLIDAEDFPLWAAALATRRQWRRPVWLRAFQLTLADVESVVETVAEALDGRLLTRAGLADQVHQRLRNAAVDERLRSGWGELLKIVALHGLLCFGPSEGRNVTFVRPDQWLTGWRTVPTDEAIAEVCRRYLASHGPATREEFARWWGFFPPDASRVIAALGDEVAQLERAGVKVYLLRRDLKALDRAEEDDEIRLLGMFDPYTLAGLPHEAVVPKERKGEVYRPGAWVSQVVLRGGRVRGVWKHEGKPAGTRVTVGLFDRRAATKAQLEEALVSLVPYIGKTAELLVTSAH